MSVNILARAEAKLRYELKRKAVELVDFRNLRLQCKDCGGTWSPNLRPQGHLENHYWLCPHEACNEHLANPQDESSG